MPTPFHVSEMLVALNVTVPSAARFSLNEPPKVRVDVLPPSFVPLGIDTLAKPTNDEFSEPLTARFVDDPGNVDQRIDLHGRAGAGELE